MKILNIAIRACFTDGYSYQDNLLPEYQHKLGHDVTILTSTATRGSDGKPSDAKPGTSLLSNGVKLIRIPLKGTLRQLFGYSHSISRVIRDEEPDLIFIHGLPSFVPAQAISYKKRHPSVILVADSHQDERNTRLKGFPFSTLISFWRSRWRKWAPSFSHIYGVTSWRTDFAHRYYGIPQNKLDTLILGVDNDRLPADREGTRHQVREELGFNDDVFVFVSGGKLEARKRIIETMAAFSKCESPKIRLLVFGSLTSDIRDSFDRLLNQDPRVKFIGFIPSKEARRYFIASDFGLFPGSHSVLWEEASGCGLPCLFSKFTENDHLQVCGNCVQLPPEAPEDAIVDVINRVANDEGYFHELRENARRAAPTFYYETIARKSIER